MPQRVTREASEQGAKQRMPDWLGFMAAFVASYADQSNEAVIVGMPGDRTEPPAKTGDSARDFVANLMVGLRPTY